METAPVRVTTHTGANEQLVYFTSTSLLEDDRRLIFISDRTGCPNIFVRDLQGGGERQLTRSAEGWLKSYVYFDGTPLQGPREGEHQCTRRERDCLFHPGQADSLSGYSWQRTAAQ